MALPVPPNVTVDIYRTFLATQPYPLAGSKPDVPQVPGYLKQHVNNGKFGYQFPKLKWTTLLLLPPGTDIRSAYNSWTGPAEPTASGDTVIIRDYPIPGACTAFYVVLVQRWDRGTANDHYRVYLDRMQPRQGGCFVPGVATSCCGNQLPNTLHATLAGVNGCSNFDGLTAALTYDFPTNSWLGQVNGLDGQTMYLKVSCSSQDSRMLMEYTCTDPNFTNGNTVEADFSSTCRPVHFLFNFTPSIGLDQCHCNTLKATVTQ